MELSKAGLRQAALLEKGLRRFRLDAVYASPMRRVRQTVQSLAAHGFPKPMYREALREVDFGAWTGHAWHEIPERFNARAYDWLEQLERAAIPVTASRINTLRNNIAKVVMIRPSVMATLNPDGMLKIHEKPVFEEPISINLRATLHPAVVYAGGILEWDFPWPPYELKNSDGWMIFDRSKIGDCVVVRHPQPGDRVRLSGRSSARPLMDVLSRNKIPREQRERAVLATTGSGEIFWVEGLRIIEGFKVTEFHDGMDQSSPSLLAWRWRRKG